MVTKTYIAEKHQKCLAELAGIQSILEDANHELTPNEVETIYDWLLYVEKHTGEAKTVIENSGMLPDTID